MTDSPQIRMIGRSDMRKLGLVGGTGPESTLVYYRELTPGVRERLGRNEFPPLAIDSLDVFHVLDLCAEDDYDTLADYMLEGVRNLAAAGADIAAFTGITVHAVLDQVAPASPIPIISMMDAAAEEAKRQGYKSLLLLGTYPTMTGDFFRSPLEAAGIRVITPSESDMHLVGTIIEDELELGIVSERAKSEVGRIVSSADSVDAVILGCTELPLLFDHISSPLPTLDVMRIHIAKLVRLVAESA